MAGRICPVRTRSEKAALTSKWRWRVQHFFPQLTGNARPFNIIRKMKPQLDFDDPIVREIITLDNDNDQCVKATEKLLDYLVSEEGLQPGEIADRWLAFDVALSEAHPLLYDIVHGKIDPMVQEQQKQAVNACMEDLTNGLDPKHLYDFLVSKDLLADTERETLSCKGEQKGPIQSAFYLLSHLHRSANKNWYQDFLEALGESGYEELVEILNDKYQDIVKGSSVLPDIVSNLDVNRVSGRYPSRQVIQEHGNATASNGARPKEKPSGNANIHEKLALGKAAQKILCQRCRGVHNKGASHRCHAPAASPPVLQEQGNATASNGARPKEKPTAYANLQEKQALSQAAATTRRRDSITTSPSVNAAELPAAIANPKKQPWPHCKMMVERLGGHTQKAVGQAAPASTEQGGATGGSGAQPIKGTDAKKKPKEQCPRCKGKYVNLNNHKICRPK